MSDRDQDPEFIFNLVDYLDSSQPSLVEGSLVARITERPQLGTLVLRNDESVSSHTVQYEWVLQAAPPHAKGRSFSSHASSCGTCCYIPGHRSPVKQQSPDCRQPCSQCPYSVFMVEGEPRRVVGDSDQGQRSALEQSWVPGCTDCGLQWITLEYEKPMYMKEVNIYETGRRGSVVRIESALQFTGDDTDWFLVWERAGGLANASGAYTSGGVFSPPVCQGTQLIRIVKVTVDTSMGGAGLKPSIDAVRIGGYYSSPRDHIRLDGGRADVVYTPRPGVHTSSEVVSFVRLEGCEKAESEKIRLHIPSTRPESPAGGTVFGGAARVNVVPFQRETVAVDPTSALEDLASVLGVPVASVSVSEVRLSNLRTNNASGFFQVGRTEEIASETKLVVLEPEAAPAQLARSFDVVLRQHEAEVRLWVVTSASATYRLKMILEGRCPPERPIADYEKMECTEKGSLNRMVVLVAASVVATLAALAAAVAVWLYRRTRRLQDELQELQGARSDIVDLDAPVNKVLAFLEELSSAKTLPTKGAIVEKASELQRLLETAKDFLNPDLEKELNGRYDESTTKFFVEEYATRTSVERSSLSSPLKRQAIASDWISFLRDLGVTSKGFMMLSQVGNCFSLDPSSLEAECNSFSLTAVAVHTICSSIICEFIGIDFQKLADWLKHIEGLYALQGLPYHCKTHVVDVTLNLMTILSKIGLGDRVGIFSELEPDAAACHMLAGLISGIIHDLGHDGLSNGFHVNVSDKLARRFNDQSVLENHSIWVALEAMKDGPHGFLDDWGRDHPHLSKLLRNLIIEMVLATDMKHHFELLSKFKMRVHPLRSKGTGNLLPGDSQQILLTLQIAIKCADLGHTAANLDIHKEWCRRLEEEFFRQGDLEREMGLPLSPLMDRFKPGVTNPKQSIGFFEVIALPLFSVMVFVYEEIRPFYAAADRNYQFWKHCVESSGMGSKHYHSVDSSYDSVMITAAD
uniref:Phosphodiesterase n=1 Tax=Tetraselmis sp. GSL018 TaxID=582737 RepID=A0A061SBX9_9CHLO|mmetsp:Transcript_26808/g.63589  ORF Transcript_26808/g.63589 Transcript_26808/m.63589 type:complete len:974 (+) Transcript_26808:1221-4142(+)